MLILKVASHSTYNATCPQPIIHYDYQLVVKRNNSKKEECFKKGKEGNTGNTCKAHHRDNQGVVKTACRHIKQPSVVKEMDRIKELVVKEMNPNTPSMTPATQHRTSPTLTPLK